MKKIFTLLFVFALVGIFTLPAFAENTTRGSTSITTEVSPAYTVTIPQKLEIPYNSTEAEALTLTACGLLLESGKTVTVTAAGSGTNGAFTMANGSKTLGYELSKTIAPWNAIHKDGEAASFSADGTAAIYAKVPDWTVTAAGKYSGTIIFTVSYH